MIKKVIEAYKRQLKSSMITCIILLSIYALILLVSILNKKNQNS